MHTIDKKNVLLSESNYDDIRKFSNESAKKCANRNFNYYISNPEFDHIAITYRMNSKDDFWGLDCSIGEQEIIQWLTVPESPFADREALDKKATELIKDHLWNFDIDSENPDLLKKAMCKRVLLAFAFHFYFCYKCSDEIAGLLTDSRKETECEEFDSIDINNDLKHLFEVQGSFLKINGRLSNDVIAQLHSKGITYSIEPEQGKYVIVLSDSETGKSILDLYKDNQISAAMRCVSPVFYSGAMARVKKILMQKNYGNERVINYLFELESVSYATHLGLKDPRSGYISTYFTNEEKSALMAFDADESCLQDQLIHALEENTEPIDAVNEYLSKSGYTHGMNTSSNITTLDDHLVFTKRGSKTFDSQTLYCSSNGVCEKFDEKVTFYHNTVDCDMPSIAEIHTFGSFSRELTRESYAELGVYIEPTLWHYYGFTVMGYKSDHTHRFPLHFNVLAYAHTDKTIEQIRKSGAHAVEKEENENIYGMKVALAKNWIEAVKIITYHLFQVIYSHKDLVADLLILFTVATLFSEKISDGRSLLLSIMLTAANINFVDWISLFTAVLTLCFTVIEIKTIISAASKKYAQTYYFVRTRGRDNDQRVISKCIKKAMKNAGCKMANPIFTLMFQLYYYQQSDQKNT